MIRGSIARSFRSCLPCPFSSPQLTFTQNTSFLCRWSRTQGHCNFDRRPLSSLPAAYSQEAADMLDAKDFADVRGAIELYDDRRESVIKRCRAIFALHRGDQVKAKAQLKEVEQIAAELLPLVQESPYLRIGSYSASMEEYGEAVAFLVFLQEGRLVKKSELPLCDPEEYLGAILDFTGELNRYSIKAATVRDKEAVKLSRDLCDAIMGEFLQFNLRNSNLRKKFDSLKYTLKKLENTMYELSLTESLGLKTMSREEEQELPGQGEKEQPLE